MRVLKSSYAQSTHDMCAELTKDEIECWRGRHITSFLGAPVYAVSARVVGLVFNSIWLMQEALRFFPRMVSLAVGLAMSEKAGLTVAYFSHIVKIYSLALKNTVAQAALAVAGAVVPELVYYKYELHKSLFSLGLNALTETMHDFPRVPSKLRKNFPYVESLVILYKRLGLTNDQFRERLHRELMFLFETDSKLSAKLLTPSSSEFQKTFCSVLFGMIKGELDSRQQNRTFAQSFVQGLNPVSLMPLISFLRPETQSQLFGYLPFSEIDLQSENNHALSYARLTGYRYRSPADTVACNHLLDKMKEANCKLRQEKIFTEDRIVEMDGPALNAVIGIGILNFVDEAEYIAGAPPAIAFTTASGQKITFMRPEQFFESQAKLTALKAELFKLNPEQKKALFERCCFSEEDVIAARTKLHPLFNDPAVIKCFNLVVTLKHGVIERKMNTAGLRPEDTTPWMQAFSVA